MSFGEILEPSTRALIEDDYEDYPESNECLLEWEGFKNVSSKIKSLICLESPKILKIFKKCILSDLTLVCSLKNCNVNIYCEPSQNKGKETTKYIITLEDIGDYCCGQMVEGLAPWLEKSQDIFTITSAPVATYQNNNKNSRFDTLLRVLSTRKEINNNYDKLDTPNFISGLSGGILSYCIHTGKNCSSFIAYMDSTPINSVSSYPVVQLAEKLGLAPKIHSLKNEIPPSNLYM